MVPEPGRSTVTASAQEAGERLSDPAVRAVLVTDDGKLVGVVTRKTLVSQVVAPGLDPRDTKLKEIAEPPLFTLEASMDLDEAFRALEEHDFERVPVVEDGRLVGILSRTVLLRRLAEDEQPPHPSPERFRDRPQQQVWAPGGAAPSSSSGNSAAASAAPSRMSRSLISSLSSPK